MNKNKFWVEDINCIFDESDLYPTKQMCLESKMNAMTRFVMSIFIILLFLEIFDMKNNILFILLSLFIIIILYYKKKRDMNKTMEYYNNNYNNKTDTPIKSCDYSQRINYSCSKPDDENVTKIKYNQNKYNVQNDYNSRGNNPNFARPTDNQFLAGGPNPKTLIPPIVPVPAMDIDYWRTNDNLTISTINSKKERYNSESGYEVVADFPTDYSYQKQRGCKSTRKRHSVYKPIPEDDIPPPPKEEKENFDFPFEIKNKNNFLNKEDSLYYKDFKNNEYFKNKYSENIFKGNVRDGKYYNNTRNEPINSNIGISEPQTFEADDSDIIEPYEDVNVSNVYDPRFHGYGTSYRGYFDKNVGQPRYYYDDVDAIKMPNYITRNHIDTTPFGDSYGPMNNEGNHHTANIHQLADKHYNDSMMQFRDEMQSRLMRKVNSEQWQQRMFPIHKHSQR